VNRAHWRPYRLARLLLSVARVMPRYARLVTRERMGRPPAPPEEWDAVHRFAARELRNLALVLAGAITKAAQIGGARADILPQVFVDELSQFHDAVPPRPFEQLKGQAEHDLQRPLDTVFSEIDTTALAAASLAQVHAARLHDGREAVIKIQYPEVRRIIPLDLGMLRATARLAHWLGPKLDLRSLVFEVARFIELELDFGRELESMERLRRILEPNPDVVVPQAFPEYCGERIIVMERLDGIPITRSAAIAAAGHRPADLARRIGALYGSMIFEIGFFHGDPHPGNLLVLQDGRIGLLDFGLCKELPKGFARRTAQLIVCALIGDTPAALEAAEDLGFDVEAIEPEQLRSLFLMMLGDSQDVGDSAPGSRQVDGFADIIGTSRIRSIPEDFALVARTLVLLNGLSHRLAPRRRLIQAELLKHLGTGAAASPADR